MTNGELIEELKKYPLDAEIINLGCYDDPIFQWSDDNYSVNLKKASRAIIWFKEQS